MWQLHHKEETQSSECASLSRHPGTWKEKKMERTWKEQKKPVWSNKLSQSLKLFFLHVDVHVHTVTSRPGKDPCCCVHLPFSWAVYDRASNGFAAGVKLASVRRRSLWGQSKQHRDQKQAPNIHKDCCLHRTLDTDTQHNHWCQSVTTATSSCLV